MFWLGLIVGIIAWQVVALIFCFLWQEDEDKFILGVTGLVGLGMLGIIKLSDFIRLCYRHYHYKAALIDEEGNLCYCESKDANFYTEDTLYTWAQNIKAKYKPDDGWSKRDCFMDTVNLRYTPIKILKTEGAYRLPKVKKSKEED